MAMNIFCNPSAQKRKVKIPVFLLYDSKNACSMGFYGFHSKFSTIFNGDFGAEAIPAIPTIPFTAFRYFPDRCNFIPYQGKILVVGGDQFCKHITRTLYNILTKNRMHNEGVSEKDISEEDIIRIVKEEATETLPSLIGHSIFTVSGISGPSNRTKAFEFQRFIDNNEQPQLHYADFDVDTEYWSSCPGLGMPRIHCHLLSSQKRVLSVVGCVDYRGLDIESEVFNDNWHPVRLPVKFYEFVSAVVNDSILIGSYFPDDQASFVIIRPDFSQYSLLENIECPPQFLLGCSELPGIVVHDSASWDDSIVVWNDKMTYCIRGLHLGHQQHFNVDFVEERIVIPNFTGVDSDSYYSLDHARNLHDAQLIGIGDGILAIIYRGGERYSTIDDQGKVQYVTDYRCVTFELLYDNPDYPARVPYPGISVKTRILSNRKCYAPFSTTLVAAFAMDVCFPHEEENLSVSSINKRRVGLHPILQ